MGEAMSEQTEWGIELPATPANGEYREPMGEARKAGLEVRNATRLERAQQRAEEGCQGNQRGSGKACDCDACAAPATEEETKRLTKLCHKLGKAEGRKEAASELEALFRGWADQVGDPTMRMAFMDAAVAANEVAASTRIFPRE
jgi:hypothetical protein